MKITIAAFSDTHGKHREITIPECDIAIFAGDISAGYGSMYETIDFLDWYSSQYLATEKIFILGNHDLFGDPERCTGRLLPQWFSDALERYTNLTYLYNNSVNIMGVNIWGSPVTPDFFPEYWAFNKKRGAKIRQTWSTIPENTDVLVTHGPAKGFLDTVPERPGFSAYPAGHVGCEDLKDRIYQLPQLKAMIVGHIHEISDTIEIYMGNRRLKYCNAAIVANGYKVMFQPQLIEIDI